MNINGVEYVEKEQTRKIESELKDANRKIAQLAVLLSVLLPSDYRVHKAIDEWMERLTKKDLDGQYWYHIDGRDKAIRLLDGIGALSDTEKTDMLREIADLKTKLNGANVKIGKLEKTIREQRAARFAKQDALALKRAAGLLAQIAVAIEEEKADS